MISIFVKKCRSILCLSSVFILLSKPVWAEDCESNFLDMRPHAANALIAKERWEAKSAAEKIVSSLALAGESGLPRLNVKSWKKEGELVLGLKSQAGETLVATYRIDGSLDGALPRLVELEGRRLGSLKMTLSEQPIDPDTGKLRPEVATHPLVASVRKDLPLELSAELTQFLRENIDVLDYAEAKDFRVLGQGKNPEADLRKLKIALKGRWIKEVLSKDLVKQVFRGLLFGGVVFGSSLLAVVVTGEDQPANKNVFDAIGALLLVELANMELEAGMKIPDQEKARLLASASSIPKKTSDGEVLRLSDVEIASTAKSRTDSGPEKFWVLDKASGRIFVGLAEVMYDVRVHGAKTGDPKVELSTRALVEIRAADMPLTYQIAIKRFQYSLEKKNEMSN